MADVTKGEGGKPQDPEGGEGGKPQDPQTQQQGGEGANDPEGGEGGKPQDPQQGEGTVNRHQYERDIERRDKRISELEAQLKAANDAKASDGDKAAQALRDVADLKAQLEDQRQTAALAAQGCVDPVAVKAAKALLGDYDGDAGKLREAAPYLFGTDKKQGATGLPPRGDAAQGRAERARKAAGLR